ncbi:hypothetical protein KAFR_0F00740 [Kazachstania africana CBS 2517]|uniref:RING-type E3 ubiquitin transferase n=1 Tax=Kazachstania africana (strain ATCC 22294 / BCRC 22015 / CBS 2517 / CECT 1963 / NBRC 1671 / NRRL Y-8276) TaxID=1071382 RepID=H2AWC1_KAZAF|nr:hypothetical protein KAFR_0F00740 [Kazachstania africana CBS 2517]CCF58671.1 hypothetical protein KAFR_0F00740 [Kazachstania africana CBS 2517]
MYNPISLSGNPDSGTPLSIENNNSNGNTTTNTPTASPPPFDSNNNLSNSSSALAAFGIQPLANSNPTRSSAGLNSLLSSFGIRQNSNAVDTNPFRNNGTNNANLLNLNTTSTVVDSVTHNNTPLPITLSLTANQQNSNNLINNAITNHISNMTNYENNEQLYNEPSTNLKNLRHWIYGPDQLSNNNNNNNTNNNNNITLHLDLPEDTVLPSSIDNATLRQRKDKSGMFSIRLTPFIDTSQQSTNNQGLFFDPIIRTAGPGSQLVIGRYTERVREAISKLPDQYHPVVFKSKVISRTHGCFKVDSQGNWFIQDVKSSSGTFLNHQRLSPASTLSKDYLLHDGDILQLGMDFRGGTEEIYRCVRMRVELNKSWKRKANKFNKEAVKRLKLLTNLMNENGMDQEDCSICLSKIKPCQAIFISPCSHSWHFHCIRRLVMVSYPQFVCPNCRASCDLEATLESEDGEEDSDYLQEEDQFDNNDDNDDNNNNNNDNEVLHQLGVTLEDPKNDIDME